MGKGTGRGTGGTGGATLGWADRLQARLSARARVPTGPLRPPEPRLAGDPEAGRRLLAGRLRLGAAVVELGARSPWDLAGDPRSDPEAVAALHACGWLDDLAALGGARARGLAQAWVWDWMARFGGGRGPGWAPGAAAGRLLRWTGHAAVLLKGRPEADQGTLSRSLARHALFLARRLRALPPGLARIEALAALVHAGLALPGAREVARQAAMGLGREAEAAVDAAGAAATRSPEDLLEALALMAEAARAVTGADLLADPAPLRALAAAAARGAPVLRALRHADGGLARFHGGDRGAEGRLDAALAAAGRPGLGGRGARAALAMGFARLAAGGATVIVDASLPPQGALSVEAHASALAIEVTVGRHPLIVSCGPGRGFGPAWRQAGRATPSHSTLTLDGLSSSRLRPPRRGEAAGRLGQGPTRVIHEPTPLSNGLRVELAQDGWRLSHGLTHARTLQLSPDGRRLAGEDLLTTLGAADARALDRALARGSPLPVQLRFHLHPDVAAEALPDGRVSLRLPDGAAWMLACEGALAIAPTVLLEAGAEAPRPSSQVVATAAVTGPSTRLRWTLARAEGTGRAAPPEEDA